jgi:hypothetical protein
MSGIFRKNSPPIYADRLFEFLTELADTAKVHGDAKIQEKIAFARRHYILPVTSEFLGVSMDVLHEVLAEAKEMFSSKQIDQAREYAVGINDQWFSKPRGGRRG